MKNGNVIGWIGTGKIGNPMCFNLLKSGLEVYVFNRTKSKAENLIADRAYWSGSSKAVAEKAEIIFISVNNPGDVEDVIFGKKGIFAAENRKVKVIINITTSVPKLDEEMFLLTKEKGISFLDSPVSGGPFGARDGSLVIMVGGKESTYNGVLPILSLMGKKVLYTGEAGSGQRMKICNQIVAAATMAGVSEALVFANQSGMDLEKVAEMLSSSVNASPIVTNQSNKIAVNNFDPGLSIDNFLKDMGIALNEADKLELPLPFLSLINQFYKSAKIHSTGSAGIQSLYKTIKKLGES